MALTSAQKKLLSRIVAGNITLKAALDESKFSVEQVAEATKIPADQLQAQVDAGVKVKDLPLGWKVKLNLAAMRLGVR